MVNPNLTVSALEPEQALSRRILDVTWATVVQDNVVTDL